jgi:hypothetical protein
VQHAHPVVALDNWFMRESLRLLERSVEREVVPDRVLPPVLVLHATVEHIPGVRVKWRGVSECDCRTHAWSACEVAWGEWVWRGGVRVV